LKAYEESEGAVGKKGLLPKRPPKVEFRMRGQVRRNGTFKGS